MLEQTIQKKTGGKISLQSGKLGIQLFNKTINSIFPKGFTYEGNMGLLDFVTNDTKIYICIRYTFIQRVFYQ